MNEEIIEIFTGTEIEVNLLKEILEKSGISSLIKNNNRSGIMAGFYGGAPFAVNLFIQEVDMAKAEPIIKDFSQ